MSPEICSTTVRIDRRRDDGDATTAATALVDENDQGVQQMYRITSVVRNKNTSVQR